jgi:hypothetical protein
MNRRGFLLGAMAAPAVICTPGLLMPVKPMAASGSAMTFPPGRFLISYGSVWRIPEGLGAAKRDRELTRQLRTLTGEPRPTAGIVPEVAFYNL